MNPPKGYRIVSLDSDPLHEDTAQEQELRRIMQAPPSPVLRGTVVTSNGNVVVPR